MGKGPLYLPEIPICQCTGIVRVSTDRRRSTLYDPLVGKGQREGRVVWRLNKKGSRQPAVRVGASPGPWRRDEHLNSVRTQLMVLGAVHKQRKISTQSNTVKLPCWPSALSHTVTQSAAMMAKCPKVISHPSQGVGSLQSPLLKKIQSLNLLQHFSSVIRRHDESAWPMMTCGGSQN